MRGVLAAAGLTAFVALGPSAAAEPDPREHYLLHCSGCHAADGRGTPGLTPSLHGLTRFLETPDGRAYLGAVPGVAQAPLDDGALARLLNWVIAEFSKERPAPPPLPYSAEEIRGLRAGPLRDPAAARPEL